jgi:membrane associated rhomboid family serine protease
MSITRDIQNALRGSNGALIRLIIINVAICLVLNILVNVLALNGAKYPEAILSDYITLPADLNQLLPRFWTLVTYMFVHFDFMHLVGNMLMLYFLGRVFSDLLGGARMTAVYLIGGICGGIVFILVENLLPNNVAQAHVLEGASAGVMAIIIAVAAYSPDYMMFPFGFPMKLKWLALIAFVISSLIDLTENTGGKVSHIGGAIFGFIYGTQLRHGKNFMGAFTDLFKRSKKNLRVEYSRSRKHDDMVYNENRVSIRRQVDEILDKISRSGYDSLTKDEKEFLQKNHDKF